VQDILTAVAYLQSRPGVSSVSLVGQDLAGAWCLLARGLTSAVGMCIADLGRLDLADDEGFVRNLDLPLLRRAGDLRTALALAAPQRLVVHNTGDAFPAAWAVRLWRTLGAGDAFLAQPSPLSDRALVELCPG